MGASDMKSDLLFYAVAGLAGWAVWRKVFGAGELPTTMAGEVSPIAVGGTLGGILQTGYNLGEETGGALGDIINYVRGGLPSLPSLSLPSLPSLSFPPLPSMPEQALPVEEFISQTPAEFYAPGGGSFWGSQPGVTLAVEPYEPSYNVSLDWPAQTELQQVMAEPVITPYQAPRVPHAPWVPAAPISVQVGGGYTAELAAAAGASRWVSGVGWV